MRIADAQLALEEFPSQAYDFNDPGVSALVTEHNEPKQLDAMATMLNNNPLRLIERVFRDSPVVRAARQYATQLADRVRQLIGRPVAAVANEIIKALQGLVNWLSKG